MKTLLDTRTILDAVGANGAGNGQLVAGLRHLCLALHTSGTTTATIKVQGSIAQAEPDWASSPSPTNSWDYIQLKGLEDAASFNGDEGIALSAADIDALYELNINHLRWVNVIVSGWTQGAITALLSGSSD